MLNLRARHKIQLAIAVGALALGYLLLVYFSFTTYKTTTDLASSTAQRIATLEQQSVALSDSLYALEQNIADVQARVGGAESVVNTLEKLRKTDPELLQKYSRVYFLNEHYAPRSLAKIEKQYVFSNDREEQVSSFVYPFLENLLNAAEDSSIELFVKSGYRSFKEQSTLKSQYTVTYGATKANTFSADQGYSEHQLGTTVDFISTGQGGNLPGFDKTEGYEWLLENAHKHGFVLSYPKNNQYYIYEPWHWRFVGVKLATDLYEDDQQFYEMEQRRIDEYLVSLYDEN